MVRPALVGCLLLAISPLLAQAPAPAPESAGQQSRRAADRVQALRREADALAGREQTLLGELRKLEVERDIKTEELAQIEREIADASKQRDEVTARLSTLEGHVETERPHLQRRIVELYKLGRAGYVRLLLDIEDTRAIGRAYRTVTAMAAQDRRRVSRFGDTLDELRASRDRLVAQTARLEGLKRDATEARQAAARAVAVRARLVADIDSRRDLNARLIGELQAAGRQLSALTSSGSPAETPASEALPIRAFRGGLDWPAAGRVVGFYGRQRDPRFGTTTLRSGIAVAALVDAPVQAVHEGTVAYADPFTGYGNLVIVDHGSQAFSLYGYLRTVAVKKGQRVGSGQVLGAVGTSPAGDPELYFELRIDGKPVDPVQWLKKR